MAYSATGLTLIRRLKSDNSVWSYISADDLGTQIGGGYFDSAAADMRVNDTIFAVGNAVTTIFLVTANTGSAVTVAQLATSEGAEPSDGDKGDIDVTATGLVWTLKTVTIAKGGTGQTTAYAGLDALTVQGANIASATTTNLATATGRYVVVTGTTTITGFGTAAAGVERIVEFSGALLLTHNATSLILPGAANVTTAAGDVARFVSEGSGNWRCVGYMAVGGLSTMRTSNVTFTGGSFTGGTDIAIADGGTGASTAANARTNLGVPYASAAEVQAGTEAAKVVSPATLTPRETIGVSVSDETSNMSAGAGKVTFRFPYAFRVATARASCTTAPTGANLVFDINKNGVSILSTKLSIDAGEKTSTTAVTPAVLSATDFADDDECSIDQDQVGSTIPGAGGKVYIIGNRL